MTPEQLVEEIRAAGGTVSVRTMKYDEDKSALEALREAAEEIAEGG